MKRIDAPTDKERPVHPTTTTERLGTPRVGEGALIWDPKPPKWWIREQERAARAAAAEERAQAE